MTLIYRCTRGLTLHTFHGNFFVRSTDLLSLPNVNPDAGFGMQVSIEGKIWKIFRKIRLICVSRSLLDVGINITCIVSYRRSKRFTRGCIPSSIAVYLITRRKKNTCPYIMLAYICICVRDHQWCRPSCSRWYACQVCSWQSHIRFCSRRKRR